jgi:hypothetical protein
MRPGPLTAGMIAYSIHTPKNDCVIINPDKGVGAIRSLFIYRR